MTTETSMRERIARALDPEAFDTYERTPANDTLTRMHYASAMNNARRKADAVLDALREPTGNMREAGAQSYGVPTPAMGTRNFHKEQASEVERLRAEVERLTREMAQLQRFKWNDEQMRMADARAEAAEAKVVKLREALRKLNEAIDAYWNDPQRPSTHRMRGSTVVVLSSRQIDARAVLAETEE